jgi:hypothetical protein
MIGVRLDSLRCRIRSAVSYPSMLGILTSIRITANRRPNTARSAARPESASATTTSSDESMARMATR